MAEGRVEININLRLRTLDGDKVVDEREKHNVYVMAGRNWLRNLIGSREYPTLTSEANMRDVHLGMAASSDYSLTESWTSPGDYYTYRARWIGVGVGGNLQVFTPPGSMSQAEIATVAGLEDPVTVKVSTIPTKSFEWMGQVEAQGDPANLALDFPEDGTIVFRHLFTEDEISFPTSVDYLGNVFGTSVPVSEVCLFTSAADPFIAPHVDAHGLAEVPGVIAYGINDPIIVTPAVSLEVVWEISFA